MKLTSYLTNQWRAAVAAVVLISFSFVNGQTTQPVSNPGAPVREFHMVVLGDSILWGQGLKEEHKIWYQVKTWLQENTGREVRAKIEAHSGAVVGSPGEPRTEYVTPRDAEVSLAVPTVNEQLNNALGSYADSSLVDLVLVDGCINDVDARNLLNGGNSTDKITRLATDKCGALVQTLLTRVANSFPSAHIVVTGYYPILSQKTPNTLLLRAVATLFYQRSPEGPKLTRKQLLQRMIDISQVWYQASNRALADAVRQTNDEIARKNLRQRVVFIEIPFPPEYSFLTSETRLWNFNANFLRKLLAALTLGKVSLGTNDETRNQRIRSCNEFFKRPAIETKQEKASRELRRALCHYSSIGHPNRKGALLYSEAIINQVKTLINEVGWPGDARAVAPANSSPLR